MPTARPAQATSTQTAAARYWSSAHLPGATPAQLTRAAATLSRHPDAERPGYSLARQALERVRGELAGRAVDNS